MKRIVTAVCCVILAPVVGLAQKDSSSKGAMTDQQFVTFAAQTDMVEANLGELAGNVAEAQPVKQYGQMLMDDHTKDFQQLSSAAGQANLTVPSAIDNEHISKMIAPFQKLKGAAFDHRYVKEMIDGHTKAIATYRKEAADAQNPAIKSYAETALPTLEKHLSEAKGLQNAK
jgi:putative membrane protein